MYKIGKIVFPLRRQKRFYAKGSLMSIKITRLAKTQPLRALKYEKG